MYGDTRILEQHYDAMVRWIQYLQHANPNLLWTNKLNNNYGDWLSIDADTPKEVLATAYFAYDALLMSKIGHALSRYDDAESYQQLFQNICAAFCTAYVSSDGRIVGGTQTCYVLALHMQLLPSELRPLAAKHLVQDIEKKGWHLSTGFVGVGYLCPVLTEEGYADVAYRLLLNETFPSWGYSIQHGATTIWERWDGWTEERGFQNPGMNSFNHYSLGSVGQWLFQYVAGIEIGRKQPGYQHTIIRPYSGNELTYAKAEYSSMSGLIKTHWQRDTNRFTLRVTVPANATATIYLPTSKGSQIIESGKRIEEAEGVVYVREEQTYTVFEVGSGEYEFVCI
jgi:alpha-L-rhamnosidase